ncbi:Potassium transporter 4, partial [Dionaea muscipula]
LCTSPFCVFMGTFKGKLENHQNVDALMGVFSLIFWTLTSIPLLKCIITVLNADDNGVVLSPTFGQGDVDAFRVPPVL